MIRVSIAVIASVLLGLLPSVWPDPKEAWDVLQACNRAEIAIWLAVLTSFVPYRNLMAKSFVACLVLIEGFEAVSYFFWWMLDYPYFWYVVKALLCLDLVFYICWRDYDRANDELDDEHFFQVGIRPVSFQDFILSMVKDPVGGVGIYADGNFYHYRHGRLVIHDRKYIDQAKGKYRIKKMRRIDRRRMKVLVSLTKSKYSKWTWIWNCKTVLEPILGKRGRPLFFRKGSAR